LSDFEQSGKKQPIFSDKLGVSVVIKEQMEHA
jgi:hypothetical protein